MFITIFTVSLPAQPMLFMAENDSILLICMAIIILLLGIVVGYIFSSNKRRTKKIESILSNHMEEIKQIVDQKTIEGKERLTPSKTVDSGTSKIHVVTIGSESSSHTETHNDLPKKLRHTESKDHELFQKLHKIIVNRKLYLNSELSRNDLQTIIHVGKNRLIDMIKNEGYNSVTIYINSLRIEHAIQLMKEQPNYTIQSIAKDSGIPNVRTFHRVFLEVTGSTPKKYKTQLNS